MSAMWIRGITVLLAAVLLLSGCVRSNDGIREVRTDEAVANRVSAALEYLQMDRPNEARQHLVRALELDNRNARAHNAMALLYRYEQDSEREEEHYRLALRADRDFAPARTNYGTMLLREGRYREAVRELERAADNQAYDRRALAYENLGRAHVRLDQPEEALEAFNRSVRLDRNTVRPYLELALLHHEKGNARTAANYFREFTNRVGGVDNHGPRALWIGIRIAEGNGNRDQRQMLERILQEEFPDSGEFRAWREWREQEGYS